MGTTSLCKTEFVIIMFNSIDLYLGSFLILAGFTLSLLNLQKLIKGCTNLTAAVLISENMVLMCIGIAFILRAEHQMNTVSANMEEIEERVSNLEMTHKFDCNFTVMLKSYGPLVISLLNSFLSLIIDNYMHYRMLGELKQEDDDNTIQSFRSHQEANSEDLRLVTFFKKYFSYVAIALQWIMPVLIAVSMYPMEVKERFLSEDLRGSSDSCMALVDVSNETCFTANLNHSIELRKLIPSYLEAYEKNLYNESVKPRIDFVVNNVKHIISNWNNNTYDNVVASSHPLWREPKKQDVCMKVCYIDNKSLLLYMFVIAVVSYFVPVTISTVILTKVHLMDVRTNMKTFVTRELLYNLLFWTPVMFDTFLSLLLCSYSMNGMRTSIFNIVANVYQAVKNFMNTKYFQNNAVEPIVA